MPETYTAEVRADSVRAKVDFIVPVDGGDDVAVMGRESKTKWTEILLETGATMRVENTTLVSVRRTRPTAEEAAAQKISDTLWWIDQQERRSAQRFETAKAELAEEMISGGWNATSKMIEMVEARAQHDIWRHVERISLNSWLKDEPLTKIEALEYLREKITEEVIGFGRFSSRSTSTFSNAVEDIERDVKVRFLKDFTWNVRL